MAITQAMHVTRTLYGDGEATEVTIDFADEIEQHKITTCDPIEVKDVATDRPADIKIKSATLSGTKLAIEFEAAPPAEAFNVVAELLFGEKAHKAARHHGKHEK